MFTEHRYEKLRGTISVVKTYIFHHIYFPIMSLSILISLSQMFTLETTRSKLTFENKVFTCNFQWREMVCDWEDARKCVIK